MLYILLFKFNLKSNITYSYLWGSIPVFIIGEYIMWYREYYRKCNMTKTRAMLNSFVSHWIPILLLVHISITKKSIQIDKRTMIFTYFSMLLYALIKHNQLKNIYKL